MKKTTIALVFFALTFLFFNGIAFSQYWNFISAVPDEINNTGVITFEDVGVVRIGYISTFKKHETCIELKTGTRWECGRKAHEEFVKAIDDAEISCTRLHIYHRGKPDVVCKNWKDEDIGLVLIEKGYGYLNTIVVPDEYLQAERNARKNKLGIWNSVEGRRVIEMRKSLPFNYGKQWVDGLDD